MAAVGSRLIMRNSCVGCAPIVREGRDEEWSAANLPLDGVAVGEGGFEAVQLVCHRE